MQELKDKVALITGGGYGIGKEIALLFGRQGMKIALAARSEGPLNETRGAVEKVGAQAIALRADVSKEADCAQMVDQTVKAFGRVDILVNNAGIAGPTKRTTEMALAEWQEVLDINLTGAWLASRAAIPAMVKAHSGNILMISSGAGRRGYPLRSPYASSKWAMIGLTQTLAGEWGADGIRVNCICPGPIRTAITDRISEEHKTIYAKRRTALGRYGDPEEVAHMTLSLCLPAASFLTGAVIAVDGGLMARNA